MADGATYSGTYCSNIAVGIVVFPFVVCCCRCFVSRLFSSSFHPCAQLSFDAFYLDVVNDVDGVLMRGPYFGAGPFSVLMLDDELLGS